MDTVQGLLLFNLNPKPSLEFCEGCSSVLTDTQLIEIENNVLILQLGIFNDKSEKCMTIKLKNPLRDIIYVNNKSFRVCSVIFHHGLTIKSGHYTNLLRCGDCWIKTNDAAEIHEEFWENNKAQPYIIFLESFTDSIRPVTQLANHLESNNIFNESTELKKSLSTCTETFANLDESHNNNTSPDSQKKLQRRKWNKVYYEKNIENFSKKKKIKLITRKININSKVAL